MKWLKDIENHEISDYFMKRICENFNFKICVVESTEVVDNVVYNFEFNIFYNNKRVFASDGKYNVYVGFYVENFKDIKSQLIEFKNHIIYLINIGFDVFTTDDGNLRITFPHGLSENEILMKMELKGLIK